MKINADVDKGEYNYEMTTTEAINLYEALLCAKRSKWAENETFSCDNINIKIVEEVY